MKQKLRLFAIHRTATSQKQTDYLNPRTRWYPALDESNWIKFTYFTIHSGENPPPQNGCRLKYVCLFFCFKKHRFHILHFLNSTGLFTIPTSRHYTKYRFSLDIDMNWLSLGNNRFKFKACEDPKDVNMWPVGLGNTYILRSRPKYGPKRHSPDIGPLVAFEPVEFGKQPARGQGFGRIN